MPDALIEICQADASGAIPDARGSLNRDRYTFTDFGRSAATLDGVYSFSTVEPGPVGGRGAVLRLHRVRRELTAELHTRIYLPGVDPDTDPLLSSLPNERQATLIAQRMPNGSLHHDIHLQGETETVFLDFG